MSANETCYNVSVEVTYSLSYYFKAMRNQKINVIKSSIIDGDMNNTFGKRDAARLLP